MNYPAIRSAQALITILKAKGIQEIVISPGSRNAPLTLGFNLDPFFKTYSIVDERCAAFFGLGIAQQINRPVAMVCTSGSALLNYYPAVAEAFYQQVPLIIISADRPASKIDIGDGQTIRQQNVFENHSLFNANLIEDDTPENHEKIVQAIAHCMHKKGPVHINIPFEEPLYELTETACSFPILKEIDPETTAFELSNEAIDVWKKSSKKLVLIGDMKPNSLDAAVVDFLANEPSIVVMSETTSNVNHPCFLNKIDAIITPFSEPDFENFKPDLLITIGGMLVSKRIKSFLRKYKPAHHWHVDALRAYNTFDCLTAHFKTDVNTFFKEISFHQSHFSNYQSEFLAIKNKRKEAHDLFMLDAPFSDMKVFEIILKIIPAATMLQISNSSPIRYTQLFDLPPNQALFCNRGTSGIDGSTSTAIGAAVGSKMPTLLITGDLSFFYDSNALWNSYIPTDFKIIVINNSGGGIFRILPGHQENEIFSTYFETTHHLTSEHLAKMYHFEYFRASEISVLNNVFDDFLRATKPAILEIFTPKNENDLVLKSYLSFLGNNQ